MRTDGVGALDVLLAPSFARASTGSETLGQIGDGGRSVGASDVSLHSSFAEALTSVPKGEGMHACAEMGVRCWMWTSLPRAPNTHEHAEPGE